MKDVSIILILSLSVLALSGCNMENIEREYKEGVIVYKDKGTGCEYLISSNHGGITPRYEQHQGELRIKGCN